ncbi:MAG: GPW/gp25 family protein [Gammaproteobacteria bacterium]|nr:GPW/gp25 family protein [Gammaproteobacteria bacterium]
MAPPAGSRDANYAGLFQRFAAVDEGDPRLLAVELADLLGGRRIFAGRGLGVLGWGMPPLSNPARASETDRLHIAECIADAIRRFEPRLERVHVSPDEESRELSFQITASLVAESSTVRLRIFSPYAKGGFGARIEVVEIGDDLHPGAVP